jgi:hypothetical protein
MTVGQLREFLAGQPDDRLVVMSKDAEGNGYSPLAVAEEAMYLAETTWSGEVYLTPEELVEEMAAGTGATEEDAAPDEAVRVVYLGPVN